MTSLSTKILSRELACCCGESAHTPVKKVDHFQLVTCRACNLVRMTKIYSNPVAFLDDVEKEAGLEYWGYPDYFQKYKSIFVNFFQERFDRIMKEKPVKGEWLDIGSGYGFWQTFLTSKDQKNYGLEIEKSAVDFSLSNGLNTEYISIEAFSTSKKYSVITMCDVLEHLERPAEILQKCYDLLLPGGLMYIQVPNVMGFKYPYKDSLGLPHHLWQFEPQTLINLMEKENFKICSYWTGVQGIIRHYENGGPGLMNKFLWKIAKTLKRGNRLQILVRK